MSKVQHPKSSAGDPVPNVSPHSRNDHYEDQSVGLWTLGVGLSVIDLRKSFSSPARDRLEVLRGVSFEAHRGEVVAIVGASGAGKSTLLHLVGGLEEPDHGRIVVGSLEIDRATAGSLARFRRTHIGLVFQFHHLLSDLSAAENVALPLMMARTGRREAMDQAIQFLGKLDLGSRAGHPVGHLSGGEQQRVAVCRALITQPDLVLADEPTGNLDASFAEEIGETLVDYAHSRGAIVLLATHNERLAQLCDRILVLRDGRVHESGTI
jgi:lipoprotein-releasing system ATP-binding protein